MGYGRVYLVTNKLNGKHYVGQTVTPHSRHGHGHAIKDAYKKYGFKMFTYEALTDGDLTDKQLDCFEKFWVEVFDSVAPNGYNLERGGKRGKYVYHSPNKGKKASEDTKKKMSASQKLHWDSLPVHPNTGKKASLETRIKMSASRTGRIQAPEERAARSVAIKQWHQKRKETANVAA
jgi:group I intron endonuclease